MKTFSDGEEVAEYQERKGHQSSGEEFGNKSVIDTPLRSWLAGWASARDGGLRSHRRVYDINSLSVATASINSRPRAL